MKRAFSQNVGDNQEYYTHPDLVGALGPFDIDVCTGEFRPWSHAPINYTLKEDGLAQDWGGKKAWGNFPFDRYGITAWYKKFSDNNNGCALQIGKTDTQWFRGYVKPFATSMLLMDQRIYFYKRSGERHEANCGGAPIIVNYGEECAQAAEDSGIGGAHVPLNMRPIFMVNMDGTWLEIVRGATKSEDSVKLQELYSYVEARYPDKCARNPHWRESIRKWYYFSQKKAA